MNLFGRDECEHLIKYNQIRLDLSAGFKGFELGKFKVEPVVLQTAGQILMLLDHNSYRLCKTISQLRDEVIDLAQK
jgi:predicted Co/Zn/Cd cation transporter (cation efflux family)